MIRAIITDFDGTLVDTFEANFRAYRYAFEKVGIPLTPEQYKDTFGLRFDAFMDRMGISDKSVSDSIRQLKMEEYPKCFDSLRPNAVLSEVIETFHLMGGRTAIASTARKENLLNALRHLRLENIFDLVFAGVDVQKGKPDPEIYIRTMAELQVSPEETLVFEDSEVGVQAAKAAGCRCVRVTPEWFE